MKRILEGIKHRRKATSLRISSVSIESVSLFVILNNGNLTFKYSELPAEHIE